MLKGFYISCLTLLLSLKAMAHPDWKEASCIGIIDEKNHLTLSIKFDVPAYYLGKSSQAAGVEELDDLMFNRELLLKRSEEKKENFSRDLLIRADGEIFAKKLITFPSGIEVKERSKQQGEADRYPVLFTAVFAADLPVDAREVEVSFPSELGIVFVNLRKEMTYQVVTSVQPGETANLVISEKSPPTFWDKLNQSSSRLMSFMREGFDHVIPDGWDHCLFMLAMFLGAASIAQAFKRSLIFTLGHSITLSLVVLGLLPKISGWIEPVIAFTIGVGAVLAYWGKASNRQMLTVPFFFGLIHGLGFAAAVTDNLKDWDKSNILSILVGFNLGVESAQASVIFLSAILIALLVKMKVDEIKLRKILCAAVAVAGFGVMFARIWDLLS
jgi:hydrogenase/urease accessory protein HupE